MNYVIAAKRLLSGLFLNLLFVACSPVTEPNGVSSEGDEQTRILNANLDAQSHWGAPHNEGYWGDSRLEANPEIAKRFNQAITQWRGHWSAGKST